MTENQGEWRFSAVTATKKTDGIRIWENYGNLLCLKRGTLKLTLYPNAFFTSTPADIRTLSPSFLSLSSHSHIQHTGWNGDCCQVWVPVLKRHHEMLHPMGSSWCLRFLVAHSVAQFTKLPCFLGKIVGPSPQNIKKCALKSVVPVIHLVLMHDWYALTYNSSV